MRGNVDDTIQNALSIVGDEFGADLAPLGLRLGETSVVKPVALALFTGDGFCVVIGLDFQELHAYVYILPTRASFPSFSRMLSEGVTLEQVVADSRESGASTDLKVLQKKTDPYRSEKLRERLVEIRPILLKYLFGGKELLRSRA